MQLAAGWKLWCAYYSTSACSRNLDATGMSAACLGPLRNWVPPSGAELTSWLWCHVQQKSLPGNCEVTWTPANNCVWPDCNYSLNLWELL